MSKTGDTKRQIIEFLQTKNGTLTDISEKLGLAPSTVSQHLKELVESGEIRSADDRPRKWKYYQINRGPVTSPYQSGFQVKRIIIPIAGILVIAVLAAGFYLSGGSRVAVAQQVYIAPGSSVPGGSTVFSLSDSPQFYNISALFITVTNASVLTSGKWYRIPLQEHTFNLVGLRNISEILSGVNLTAGSYDAVSLSVSNVTAIVNGTSKSVFLPSGKLLVVGRFNISPNSTNWVNIDFDLQRSLHLTGNGTLIMLPVLLISHQTDNDIGLNTSSIVVVRGPASMHEDFEFGMEVNGSMKGNFTFPQNTSVDIFNGRVRDRGEGPPQFFISTRRGFVMGPNAMWFFSGNFMNGSFEANEPYAGPMGAAEILNWSANAVVSNGYENQSSGFNSSGNWQGPGNGMGHWLVRLPPGIADYNSSGYADCRFSDGGVACSQNDSMNASAPTGRLVIVGGSCAGLRPGEC
jgi:DNA-binding transcriptional ArsR family regulator